MAQAQPKSFSMRIGFDIPWRDLDMWKKIFIALLLPAVFAGIFFSALCASAPILWLQSWNGPTPPVNFMLVLAFFSFYSVLMALAWRALIAELRRRIFNCTCFMLATGFTSGYAFAIYSIVYHTNFGK